MLPPMAETDLDFWGKVQEADSCHLLWGTRKFRQKSPIVPSGQGILVSYLLQALLAVDTGTSCHENPLSLFDTFTYACLERVLSWPQAWRNGGIEQ